MMLIELEKIQKPYFLADKYFFLIRIENFLPSKTF